jgi:1,4-dihydroxy-2-naphthoate octaprenyltransferase
MPGPAGMEPERVRRRPRRTARSLLAALRAGASEGVEQLDGAGLWWLALRPATFALSAISVAIGALVVAGAGGLGAAEAGAVTAVLIGVLAAHGGRNLLDHWSELGREGAGDRHPGGAADSPSRDAARVAAMRLGRRSVLLGAALAYAAGAAVLLLLVRVSGPGVAWFGAAGLALSLVDVLPPLALKRRGAGALAGAIAWGPLIVAGAAFAVRGEAPAAAWLASVAFALPVGAALLAERLDARAGQAEREAQDARPGDDRGRDMVVKLAQLALMWIGALVVAGTVTPWALLALLGLPRLRRLAVAYAPRSDGRGRQIRAGARDAVVAMRFARTTGALFALGLAIGRVGGAPQ